MDFSFLKQQHGALTDAFLQFVRFNAEANSDETIKNLKTDVTFAQLRDQIQQTKCYTSQDAVIQLSNTATFFRFSKPVKFKVKFRAYEALRAWKDV